MTPEQLAKSGTEHGHQVAFFQWCALNQRAYPALTFAFAIPNGGQRGDGTKRGRMIAGANMKAEGVKPGVPDIFLPVPMQPDVGVPTTVRYHGLFIEMKKPEYKTRKNGGCSDEQLQWHDALRGQGYVVVVAFGWTEAAVYAERYLMGRLGIW